jgi:pentose-5-phosphate-3-epimerase
MERPLVEYTEALSLGPLTIQQTSFITKAPADEHLIVEQVSKFTTINFWRGKERKVLMFDW